MKRLSISGILKGMIVVVGGLLGVRALRTTQPRLASQSPTSALTTPASPTTPLAASNNPTAPHRQPQKPKLRYNMILMLVLTCGLATIWFLIPPNEPANAAVISVIASGASISEDSAIAVINNTVFVVYHDLTLRDLFIAICANPSCSVRTIRVIDNNAATGRMRIASVNNSPAVVYHDSLSNNIKLALCIDSQCSADPLIRTIAPASPIASISITVVGGLPIISYRDGNSSTSVLKVAACSNATCSTAPTITTIDSSAGVGGGTAMTIGNSGFPVISYVDTINQTLKVAFCSTATCSASSIITISGAVPIASSETSITILNGNPIISYMNTFDSTVRIAACTNSICGDHVIISILDPTGGNSNAIANLGNLVVIAYVEFLVEYDLKMVRCDNLNCTARTTFYLDTAGSVGAEPQVAGYMGLPVISYYDQTNNAIKIFYGGDFIVQPSPTPSRTQPPTNTVTPSPTPVSTCSGLRAINPRFEGNRLLVDLVNQNIRPATLNHVDLNWQTVGGFPAMYLHEMSMNSEAHWVGMDTNPPTSTLAEPEYNAAANRTVPARSSVIWSAQFLDGPSELGDSMTINNFTNSAFHFPDPNGGGTCTVTLNLIPQPSATYTPSPMATFTPSPTFTPTRTLTFTPTATLTRTPTLTPSPTPVSMTISENEFFAAVVEARQAYPDIVTIVPDFMPDAINMTIATSSGTVGNVTVTVTQVQGFVAFSITSITVNGTAAPASYVEIINRDLPTILTTALDSLVVERFTSLADVQSITINGDTMTLGTLP
jgi:hypothetical protein